MTITKGMKVMWRGTFGEDAPKSARFTRIERTTRPREKYGEEAQSVSWINGGWSFPFVCILDNGHWAYSNQIKPMGV
jgi:hypothetical protein